MIVPFSKICCYLSDFDGRYIPSFISDACSNGDVTDGFLLVESENKSGYVLISGGRPVLSSVIVSSGDQLVTNVTMESLLEEKKVDLYLMSVEKESDFKVLSDFFAYPISVYAPYGLINVPKLISSFAEKKEDALLCFRHGAAMNIALFKGGNFVKLSYFDTSENRYFTETDPVRFGSYLGSLDLSAPLVMCRYISENAFASSFFSSGLEFMEKDPIAAETDAYFRLFSTVFAYFADQLGAEKAGTLAEKLISILRNRYPMLYSALGYSPESGKINWESVLDDRKYISPEYRYGEYYKYLDGILSVLLQTASAVLRPEKMKSMAIEIRSFVRSAVPEYADSAEMFDRIDGLLKNLRQ